MVKIVDAHMHCWDLGKINYSWLTPDAGILFNNYSPADLEGERTTIGIDGAILVQSDNSLEDSSFMFEQAMKYPWIKGVVAWLPLDNTAATERILVDQYLHQPTFKGIRHLMHLEADEWLLQDEVVDSLRVLADHQIAFDAIGINRNQFRTIIEVGRRIPTLRMVIDHLNQPPLVDAGGFKEWKELMREASALPGMHAKISGLGTVKRSVQATLTEAIRPAVATALETFGENRCFCGGDWPISLLDNSYVNTWTAYQKVLHEVMGEGTSIHKILYDNTLRFYRREA